MVTVKAVLWDETSRIPLTLVGWKVITSQIRSTQVSSSCFDTVDLWSQQRKAGSIFLPCWLQDVGLCCWTCFSLISSSSSWCYSKQLYLLSHKIRKRHEAQKGKKIQHESGQKTRNPVTIMFCRIRAVDIGLNAAGSYRKVWKWVQRV